jgi:peptidoglycan hydrolase CwlO-like protein
MNTNTKYLSEAEKVRLKLLEDEIFMLNNKVERTLKKRDRLQREVKRINGMTAKSNGS